jgi:hypothetical protein
MKIGIYKTLIRPIIFYGAEAPTFSEDSYERLRVCEGEILRRFYGAPHNNGLLRIRFNCVLRILYKYVDIATSVNWSGHINRMEGKDKQILKSQPEDVRRRGRPRSRWRECVWTDIKEQRITSWRKTSRNVNELKEIVKGAKVHFGQYDEVRRRIKRACLHLRC